MVITSRTNENIKKLKLLIKDKKNRYDAGEFVAEGVTIVKDIPAELISRVFIREGDFDKLSYLAKGKPCYSVKDDVFDSVADTKTPSGAIAVIKIPVQRAVEGNLALLLCGVSDAGNVGTIIRTACARGIDSVVCVNTADPYSPKAVRAAMGGTGKVNICQTDLQSALDMLDDYELIALDMGGICIHDYKQAGKTVLAVGNEAHGVPAEVLSKADKIISIPMVENGVESLNAAVSVGIAMYLI